MPPVNTLKNTQKQLVRNPIYHQLNDLLRDLVRQGGFKVGDQFLTERQVSERFQVSRVTANKALSQLVMGGMLEFRKGVGTFVRGQALQNDLRDLVSFTHKAIASGTVPSTKVLTFKTIDADKARPEVAKSLNVAAGDRLFYFERLRLADDVPVILERRHVVAYFCPGLTAEKVEGSLYTLFADEFKLTITGAEQTIRAVNLTTEDARLLQAHPRDSALWVRATGCAGVPLWLEDTLYRGDRYEFQNVLGNLLPPQPARLALGMLTDHPSSNSL